MLVLDTISYYVFNTIPEYTFATIIYRAATYMRYHLFAGRLHLLIIPIHTDRYGPQWAKRSQYHNLLRVMGKLFHIDALCGDVTYRGTMENIWCVHCSGISRLDDFIYFHLFYLFYKSIITSILGKVIVTKRCVDV